MAATDIYLDQASGAKASRPQLDLVLRLLRHGHTLTVTWLDWLGRSMRWPGWCESIDAQ